MSASNYAELLAHKGHKLEVVTYGIENDLANVAIECLTCNEVLIDFEAEEEEEKAFSLITESDGGIDVEVGSEEECKERRIAILRAWASNDKYFYAEYKAGAEPFLDNADINSEEDFLERYYDELDPDTRLIILKAKVLA